MKFEAAKADVIDRAFNKALFALKEQALGDCNLYVRVDQGTLRDTSYSSINGMTLTLTWDQPYAKRVYYTGTPSIDKNPLASLQWAAKAKDLYKNDWAAILTKGMNI